MRIGLEHAWVAALLALGGCTEAPQKNVLVFAASSLTEAFVELEQVFEEKHRDVDLLLNFAGSQALRVQIEQGAPADVFVSANEAHMSALAASGLTRAGLRFAKNTLSIVVPESNPANVRSFDDLPLAKKIVVGTEAVPIGAYTRAMLQRVGEDKGAAFVRAVEENIVSREANVRLVLAKVSLGEADLAVVYTTDTRSARVKTIPIPARFQRPVHYFLSTLERTKNREIAERFVTMVRGAQGRAVLQRHGFSTENL